MNVIISPQRKNISHSPTGGYKKYVHQVYLLAQINFTLSLSLPKKCDQYIRFRYLWAKLKFERKFSEWLH